MSANKGTGRPRENHKISPKSTIATILYNSTIVLVGMIFILNSTLVLSRMVPILSSIFVLQYACIAVRLYYSNFILLVRLYYSNFILLRMILITSSTPVL